MGVGWSERYDIQEKCEFRGYSLASSKHMYGRKCSE